MKFFKRPFSFMQNLWLYIVSFMRSLWLNRAGQGMVEYGLILALVAVVIIATLALIGDELLTVFNDILTELGGTPPT